MIDISIIILNYNTSNYAERLIASIYNYLDSDNYEVIVADNNSIDKSYRDLKYKYPLIKIFDNQSNNGFASGNNIAAKYAKGKYLLFLNPDIVLLDNSINKLCNYLNDHPDTGIVSGLMLDENYSSLYFYNNFWNIEWEIYQCLGIGYLRKIKKLLFRKEIIEKKSFEVDWFHGAFIFISKANYEKINGFNESHFMYFEDMDLCYDVKNKLNLKNVCLPYVKYFHETRATFKDVKDDDLYYFHINRGKLIFLRNYGFIYRNIIKLISLAGITIRVICLPLWGKYRRRKKQKLAQLLKIVKLHFNKKYLLNSKYEFVKQ